MPRLSWTYEAVESLRDVYSHIAVDRPRTAERTVASIVNKVASLAAAPQSGQRYAYAEGEEVFLLTYGHFRIAYCVSPPTRSGPSAGPTDSLSAPPNPGMAPSEVRAVEAQRALTRETEARGPADETVVILGVFHGLIFLPKR